MASTSSSSSSSSHPNDSHYNRYDVFISFRGEDTRHTFTDHLYQALLRVGLRTFRDNDEIDRGQELKPELETAIVESRASIVVLSENYANSRWCLDELWLILEQRRKFGHFVLPVFYHVDPSNVRNQRRSFAIEGSKSKAEDVIRWKEALTKVANLTGMVVSGSETDFITAVVDTIQCKLDMKQLSTPTHLIGMETRLEVISSWLKNDQSNAIAICGMGGSGKTTLAQCVYNLNKQDFESSSFVEEVGKHYKHGLLELQKQLLRDVLGGKEMMISSVSEGTHKIEVVLHMKRVLIVLDDIDDQDELSILLGTQAFPTKSKIIITTRLLDINAWFASISWSCCVYKLKFLNDLESLELLCWHAFGSKIPMEGFEELAIQLAQYCGGNPLALKVLGSSLFVGDEDPHKRNDMIKIWIERMNSLNSLKGDLDCKIQDVLRKSFDSLQLNSHKELFLDIASFFVGESKDMVTILRDDLHAKFGIMALINRCLLSVSRDTNELMMHQLLQDMGRKIVCKESKNPAKRSRVWNDDESYRVLRIGDGSNTIEGLALDMQIFKERGMTRKELLIETSSIAKMDKLKLLNLKCVKLTGPYKNFPELRWLCLHGSPLITMPCGLLVSSLVAIYMSCGSLKRFEVPKVLGSLKILDLGSSFSLVSIRGLHRLPKLETLVLQNCINLSHICKFIGDLECLANLNLTWCTRLWRVSSNNKILERLKARYVGGRAREQLLLSLPKSLSVLHLNNCDLKDANIVFGAKMSLYNLFLNDNPFEYLPNIIDLKMLGKLSLYSCHNLKSLLGMPNTLKVLHVDGCKSLERITFESSRFSLEQFSYEGCSKLCEVQGLFKLVPLAKVDMPEALPSKDWLKSFEDHKVLLTLGGTNEVRHWRTQVLYEYGITSTYLKFDITSQSMRQYKDFPLVSTKGVCFQVPLNKRKCGNAGLTVGCAYQLSESEDELMYLLARICNTTKGLTWVYNPFVHCEPENDEDVLWLSYWPIGNMLDAGDEVRVLIHVGEGMKIVIGSIRVEYISDSEVEEEENNTMMMIHEEVIGGDLSEFEVATEAYYLSLSDIFGSRTLSWLKWLFGDNVHYPVSQGWRKSLSHR